MSETTRLLLEAAERLFTLHCTRDVVNRAEANEFPAPLWAAIEDAGLPLAAIPEASGGAGAEWSDAFAVLRLAARFAAPVPLAETMLAAWLIDAANLPLGRGPMTIAPARLQDRLTLERDGTEWRLSGSVERIPFATHARTLVALAGTAEGTMIAIVSEPQRAHIAPRHNIAGEPRETVVFDRLPLSADSIRQSPAGIDKAALFRRGALARVVQMAGALEAALEQSVRYAGERVQFGRPIAKFQAIQQQLAVLAGQVAAAAAATNAAIEALGSAREPLAIAIAKARVGEAATIGAGIAHQVHGATGFTHEHTLHQSTRRLWSWREEFGAETYWSAEIGRSIAARGADELWPTITS
jgi:acyl-CoA dehydrogenase